MRKNSLLALAPAVIGATIFGSSHLGFASDHDDGETDLKSRALNLTDHYAFKSGTDLSLVMYFNPRSLAGTQYLMSPNARYEFHVAKVASKTTAPNTTADYVFRFEAGAADAAGVQPITLTVLKNGTVVGTHSGNSTSFAGSKNNSNLTINNGSAGGVTLKYFVGMRADSFHFDVTRFFQVRSFLASRFFGGAGGKGNAAAEAPPLTCDNRPFLTEALTPPHNYNIDRVHLFNPPSCAPDFTKNYNVTSITLNVPIADLGGPVFDTWSIITVKQ